MNPKKDTKSVDTDFNDGFETEPEEVVERLPGIKPQIIVRDGSGKIEKEVIQDRPTVVMSELDSIIHERMKGQPRTLDAVDLSVSRTEAPGLHRMSLPPYFEQFSYDCTRGDVCEIHRRDKKTQEVLNRGKYILRWILKDKRSIDYAMNVKGWYLVNRSYFKDAPNILFSTSGGIEIGDSILAFMSVEKALKIRSFPEQRSRELLRSRMTPSKKKPNRMLMTGDPDNENIYEPDMSGDDLDKGEGSAAVPGSLQEGRDF